MLSFLKKWLFPSAMEDMYVTERKIARRKRALLRFKVMTYTEWCKDRGITKEERELLSNDIAVSYAEYVARKDVERKALERGQH